MRVAWFSPMPPSRSGIAAYSAEILPRLRPRCERIDVFVDGHPRLDAPGIFSAHDYVWKRRRTPYDVTVYQLGNAACHDYMWAYLFRYPGVVVLHDAQVHQARALALTTRRPPRRDDYLAEFAANHPGAPADLGELFAAGLGEALYQHWPLIRLILLSARLTVVHNRGLCRALQEQHPDAALESIEMGVADPLEGESRQEAGGNRQTAEGTRHKALGARHTAEGIRQQHGVPAEAFVLAAFGGITPEKRIGPLVKAVSALADRHPSLQLVLVGAPAAHFDALETARTWGIADRVHVTGFVPDEDLPAYLTMADACACLRWPTNRETSASWLRCLAAARPTIISDLTHLADVPTLDPRGWRLLTAGERRAPVAISIDVLDEHHALQLALDRLIAESPFRVALGRAAREWWAAHHTLGRMADAYERTLAAGASRAAPEPPLPAHLRDDYSATARQLAAALGLVQYLPELLEPASRQQQSVVDAT